jgi:hypothetical protein
VVSMVTCTPFDFCAHHKLKECSFGNLEHFGSVHHGVRGDIRNVLDMIYEFVVMCVR